MTYLRALFLNFLVVFFVDRAIPGIEVGSYENVPNIGADILFAVILGFLNASIFAALVILGVRVSMMKIAVIGFIISFGAFIIIGFASFGVHTSSFWGGVLGGLIVWCASMFSNYLEMKHSFTRKK